jgi:hypothetical protein
VLVGAGSASAASVTPFGCRASTLRVALLNTEITEPTIANPNTTPCKTDTAGASTVSVTVTGTAPVVAGPVGAFTYSSFSTTGATAPGATSVAAVQGVTLPNPSGGEIVVAGPIQTSASYSCSDNKLVASGTSTLNVIYINGVATPVPTGSPTTIQLGGGSYISINEQIVTSNSLTERALDVHLAGLADVVVAEAKVTQSTSDPCAGTSGPPPVLEICPPGSTLNITAQVCEIIITNPNGTTTVIVVSKPFQGPSGGTVYPTSVVAKKYPGYPCTTGPGPKFALVATKVGGRVYGTPKSDRILALGAFERIAGLGGNDCINGNGGHQTIYDGNGKDRVWAAAHHNRIGVGNGNDYVNGRNGSDYITAGNGNDTIWGGSGSDYIAVGLGRDKVHGGKAGHNHIFAGADRALVSCGSGKGNTAFVRVEAAGYARKHGCQHIIDLH